MDKRKSIAKRSVTSRSSRKSLARKSHLSKKSKITNTNKQDDSYESIGDPVTNEVVFEIIVFSVENIVVAEYPADVAVSVFYRDVEIGTTQGETIEGPGQKSFMFKMEYRLMNPDDEDLTNLIAYPFKFVLNEGKGLKGKEGVNGYRIDLIPTSESSEMRKVRRGGKKRRTIIPNSDQTNAELMLSTTCLGISTIDVLPIIQGESRIEEVMVMESPDETSPARPKPYGELPLLRAAIIDVSQFSILIPDLANIAFFTIESLYNFGSPEFPPTSFAHYYASTVIPVTPIEPSEERRFKVIHFEHGKPENGVDTNFRKKWFDMTDSPGRTGLTKYKINYAFNDIRNQDGINVDFLKLAESEGPRVNWNTLRRIWLTKEREDYFRECLIQFRCWPIEITVSTTAALDIRSRISIRATPSVTGEASTSASVDVHHKGTLQRGYSMAKGKNRKNSVRSKRGRSPWEPPGHKRSGQWKADVMHYIAYADLTELLFPGVTSTRVACPLAEYVPEVAQEKWGVDESIMGPLVYRSGHHSSSFLAPSFAARPNHIPFSDSKPCFVLVEVQMLNPLVPKKTDEELILGLRELLTTNIDERDKSTFLKLMNQEFRLCIEELVVEINREYKDYLYMRENPISDSISYKGNSFFTHMEMSGAMEKIKQTLKDKMTPYIYNVIGRPGPGITGEKLKSYLSDLYVRLIEDIYAIINRMDPSMNFEDVPGDVVPSLDLLLFAIEATDQLDYKKAKCFLEKRLENEGMRNPDNWVDLAICSLRFGEVAEAIEIVKEVISLDIRHKEGLLIYAVLMTIAGELDTAELLFNACTQFHPTFIEGWIGQHIYYYLVEKAEGAEVALTTAFRLLDAPGSVFEPLKRPVLSWKPYRSPRNVFFNAATYFLNLNLYEFAEICLARELDRSKVKSADYYYYLAVCHHVQGRYADSNAHLDSVIKLEFANPKLWTLMGHNFIHNGQFVKAIDAYNCAINSDSPGETHLLYLRMGYYYLDQEDAENAKKAFLKVLNKRKTPLAWLGLGIAHYLADEIHDAECALMEANFLDPTLATVWAYLALVNIQKLDEPMYLQCIQEAKKYGLDDDALLDKVERMQMDVFCGTRSLMQTQQSIVSFLSNVTISKEGTRDRQSIDSDLDVDIAVEIQSSMSVLKGTGKPSDRGSVVTAPKGLLKPLKEL